MSKNSSVGLDAEWVELIQQALNLGLTAKEIRNFLKQESRITEVS